MARIGKTPDGRHPPLIDLLEEPEIRLLERVVQGPTGKLARFFNAANPNPADVRGLLATTRHWYAFFSLWTAYLEPVRGSLRVAHRARNGQIRHRHGKP